MDVMVRRNTSSTDDGLGNGRKCENSPFLSKERDEKVRKIFNKVVKKCTWVNFVIIDFQILIGSIWFWKQRKNRKNLSCDFLGDEDSSIFGPRTCMVYHRTRALFVLLKTNLSMTPILFSPIFRKTNVEFSVGCFGLQQGSHTRIIRVCHLFWPMIYCVRFLFRKKESIQAFFGDNFDWEETHAPRTNRDIVSFISIYLNRKQSDNILRSVEPIRNANLASPFPFKRDTD